MLAPLLTPPKALGGDALGEGRQYDELGDGLGRLLEGEGRALAALGAVRPAAAGCGAPGLQPRVCADCALDLDPAAPEELKWL